MWLEADSNINLLPAPHSLRTKNGVITEPEEGSEERRDVLPQGIPVWVQIPQADTLFPCLFTDTS